MLDKLKKALKITSSEQDALLEELLLQSRMVVERRLWYSLEKKIYTEVLNSDNQTSLFFLQAPILDIIKITWGTVKKLRKNALYLKKPICKEITVEYHGGFESLPQAIALAMVNLAREMHNQLSSDGLEIKSKRISALSISYFTPEEVKKGSTVLQETDLKTLLAPYKLLHCYVI